MITNPKQRRFLFFVFSLTIIASVLSFTGILIGDRQAKESHLNSELNRRLWELSRMILGDYRKQASFLAQQDQVKEFLAFTTVQGRRGLNQPLELIRGLTGASLVYLIDNDGTVRASAGDQLLGDNFKFRPYFQKASKGEASVYLGQGTVTKERGIYFAYPVEDAKGKILGVAAIKQTMASIDAYLQKTSPSPMALVSKDGVIFSTNQPPWLFKSPKPMDPKTLARLRAEKTANEEIVSLKWEFKDGLVWDDGQAFFYKESLLPETEGVTLISLIPYSLPWLYWALVLTGIWATFGLVVLVKLSSEKNSTNRSLAQKLQEQLLREAVHVENEKRFQEYFDHAVVGMMSVNVDQTWCIINRRLPEIYGYPAEEIRYKPWKEFTHPEDIPREERLMQDLNNGVIDYFQIDKRIIRQNGEVRNVNLGLKAVRGESGAIEVFHVMVLDNTERMKAEEDIRQSQKLAALGQLAGGVAHEFNNLLGGVLGYAELLELMSKPDESSKEYIQGIRVAAKRAGDLTRKLLTFSRKSPLSFKDMDLHELLIETLDLLKLSQNPKVRVELLCQATEARLWGDEAQLQGVFLNLCLNACDAMPGGGVLTVRTASADDSVIVEVTDTGTGITPEVLSRIFEPFFTTKAPGKGTGLGLSMVYSCIQDHFGKISIDTVPGSGTTFTITLPINHSQQVPNPGQLPRIQSIAGPLLVVDDEQHILRPCAALLTALGYEVLTASSGEEALQVLSREPRPLGGVLMDRLMPGMTGIETWKKIEKLKPDIKVILMSGYVGHDEVEQWLSEGLTAFLPKPFDREALQEALSKLNKGPEA